MIEEIKKVKDGCIVKIDKEWWTEYCFECKFQWEVQCIQKRLFWIVADLESKQKQEWF